MRNYVGLLADGDFEQRVLYKPSSKSVGGVPGDKPTTKRKQSSSTRSQRSSAKVHAYADPVPNKQSTLVSYVK